MLAAGRSSGTSQDRSGEQVLSEQPTHQGLLTTDTAGGRLALVFKKKWGEWLFFSWQGVGEKPQPTLWGSLRFLYFRV